jgi:hypothetical protein
MACLSVGLPGLDSKRRCRQLDSSRALPQLPILTGKTKDEPGIGTKRGLLKRRLQRSAKPRRDHILRLAARFGGLAAVHLRSKGFGRRTRAEAWVFSTGGASIASTPVANSP